MLSSPLTDQFRLEGSDQLRDFLTVAFAAVKDVRYHTQTGEGDTYALVYRARVGSQSFEEVQTAAARRQSTHQRRSRSSGVRCRPSPP